MRPVCLLGVFTVLALPVQAQKFGSQQFITGPTAAGALSVQAVDLDGDGDEDVLVALAGIDSIAWYENLGAGALDRLKLISTPLHGPTSAFARDLDGDGDVDVLYSYASSGTVAWIENLGGATFGIERVISTAASSVGSVSAADLDGDGDADVIAVVDDRIVSYENQGGGIFGSEQPITFAGDDADSFHTADLDGDGAVDVVTASRAGNEIAWYQNMGFAVFGSKQVITNAVNVPTAAFAIDLDGDGDCDLLSSSYLDDKIAWYENQGGGVFGSQQIISTAADEAVLVLGADLDGDGDVDVLTGGIDIRWHENLGAGVFGPEHVVSTTADAPISVCASDLNGDGVIELVAAVVDSTYKIVWHDGLGAGAFGPQQVISVEAYDVTSMVTADLDGDGDSDVLHGMWRSSDSAVWVENLGGGAFGPQQVLLSAGYVNSVHAADVDGDGDLDVLFASNVEGLVWRENLGSGVFGVLRVIAPAAGDVCCVRTADLDGDGDLDVLSLAGFPLAATWHENLGMGMLGRAQIVTTAPTRLTCFIPRDLNGDGRPDLVFGTRDEIAWCENLGGGNFGPSRTIAAHSDVKSVDLADLDGDGDLDVLSANSNLPFVSAIDDQIAWNENQGGGVFGPTQIIDNTTAGAGFVHAADVDGDGDVDVLSAFSEPLWTGGSNYGVVAWSENEGGGSFAPLRTISTAAFGAVAVQTADLDGDGRIDALSASSWDGKIAWYRNLGRESLGERYCSPAVPNSTFLPGVLYAAGSLDVADNDVTLAALQLPRHSYGLFLASELQWFTHPVGNSQGALCLGGFLGRFVGPGQVQNSGAAGSFHLAIDLGAIPTSLGFVVAQPGDTWNFQAWFRDATPTVTSNFTDAVAVTFE